MLRPSRLLWFPLALIVSAVTLTAFINTGHAIAPPLKGSALQTPLSSPQQILHVLNRLSFGPSPGDFEAVSRIGITQYINQQLHPENIQESSIITQAIDGYETKHLSNIELFKQFNLDIAKPIQTLRAARKNGDLDANSQMQLKALQTKQRQVVFESTQAKLLRALNSPRQLQEVMTEFWFNHFNIYADKGLDSIWIGSYEDNAIRPHALGRFRDLLEATAHHPAMLFYLDNWLNTAPDSPGARGRFIGLNENYARELLELHTLGVDSGYTQKDVTEVARVLTGWGLATQRNVQTQAVPSGLTQGFYFDSNRHDFGTKVILGHTFPGTGDNEIEALLDMLARHPATAHHISYQLAQAFVSDNPPDALVKNLTKVYLTSDGNIRIVLTALFKSPEFWSQTAYQSKFKNPFQYEVSALRLAGVHTLPRPQYFTGQLMLAGMPLYGCLTPNGYKNTALAWLNPEALTWDLNLATSIGMGRAPLDLTTPLTLQALQETYGAPIAPKTTAAIESAAPRLQVSLFLGSPDFVKY